MEFGVDLPGIGLIGVPQQIVDRIRLRSKQPYRNFYHVDADVKIYITTNDWLEKNIIKQRYWLNQLRGKYLLVLGTINYSIKNQLEAIGIHIVVNVSEEDLVNEINQIFNNHKQRPFVILSLVPSKSVSRGKTSAKFYEFIQKNRLIEPIDVFFVNTQFGAIERIQRQTKNNRIHGVIISEQHPLSLNDQPKLATELISSIKGSTYHTHISLVQTNEQLTQSFILKNHINNLDISITKTFETAFKSAVHYLHHKYPTINHQF